MQKYNENFNISTIFNALRISNHFKKIMSKQNETI